MDPWRWLIRGLGGLLGMMLAWAKEGGIMTPEQESDMLRYRDLIDKIVLEQREKRGANPTNQ